PHLRAYRTSAIVLRSYRAAGSRPDAGKVHLSCGLERDLKTQEAHFLPARAAVETRQVARIDQRMSVPRPARVESAGVAMKTMRVAAVSMNGLLGVPEQTLSTIDTR